MKKGIVFAPLVFFAVFVLAAFFWWQGASRSLSSNAVPVRFVVAKGSSASEIASDLEKEGLIKSALAFKIYTQVKGLTKSIQAGEYTLARNKNVSQIVSILLKGPDEVWVTIPEGLRREEVVDILTKGLELSGQDAADFAAEFLKLTVEKEGYLFPDTYLFPRDISVQKVVSVLLATFEKKTADLNLDEEKIILASIVERESAKDSERPVVAGILVNRLDIGMPLQADATVQYIVGRSGGWWPNITREDLKIDSKYNTYKYSGFPPSPISNPGWSSLQAAASPADTPYFYYLHDSKGEIHYAKTLEEHNANVAKYLK